MKDTQADMPTETIEAVERDYAEGWYTGAAERIARALRPSLVKRTLAKDSAGSTTIDRTRTRDGMVALTRDGVGLGFKGDHVFDLEILDIFRDIATARCLPAEYVDDLHPARPGADDWKTVNVLRQLREGDFEAGD